MEKVSKGSTIASAVSITQKQSQERANCWSITINNPTQEELELWKKATENHWVKEAVGQLERGESGTPHIQGLLRTTQVRFAQVKKLFPRAHIEVARNANALAKYVQKEDTRVAALESASAVAVEVMTPRRLQDELASVVYRMCTLNGGVLRHEKRSIRVPGLMEDMDQWVVEDYGLMYVPYWGYRMGCSSTVALIEQNAAFIRAHADMIIDEAISTIIKSGVYGAEYATANMACRHALKRYLVEILIRNANHAEKEREAQVNASRSEETSAVSDEVD